ncbi:methyltransferase small [Desulfurobacterium thermolithotrophum DSM 11699]|uniref:Methyltransferase small n=1 Tax=Desulfurobacterium thermolithotrophum (strain DSM 11699 / BSA) TaxID=868864 RepID=F0S071_DESTD|nr:tRNA1(Val) (adenine(37)-N6)-methyltransferase [Desulfurobacterium thermolithotrophum]ADY73750.1 methyltransferase small [Desulfurobacterium thermolithotrophum DSM 11699]
MKMDKEIYDISTFLDKRTCFIQRKDGFRFGTDTFLLADFVKVKGTEKIIDLGTGCGVIPILLLKKYPQLKAFAIDVLEENINISKKNGEINGVSERFTALHLNVKEVKKVFKSGEFDIVITNPPFIEVGRGNLSQKDHRAIARQELTASLEDFIKAASYLLKNKGKLYILLPVQRFVDVIFLTRKYKVEPKRLRIIHPEAEKEANLFLLEGRKGGGKGISIEFPLIVYKNAKERVYTEEVERKYNSFLR